MNSTPFLTPLSVVREAGLKRLAQDKAAFLDETAESLAAGPFRVTDKASPPPGGTLHDYWSLGPYWWPDPDKPNGLPYIRRDGHVNPESRGGGFDRTRLDGLAHAVNILLTAWAATGDAAHSNRIVFLLRAFFLDANTRMNPSLTYGQAIPGVCDGRGIGIIETTRLIDLLDAVVHLHHAGACPDEDWNELRKWIGDYLDWLLTSKHGREERAAKNNHGTWMDAQLVAFALFTGRTRLAREVAQDVPATRIDSQIAADGSQPHELARTRPFMYSVFNLAAFATLARLARHVGIDLWNHRGPQGQSIPSALDFLVPFAAGEKPWPYRQINETTGEERQELDPDALARFNTLARRMDHCQSPTRRES
ncbi:MAG: alginate lyase family protein [Kiritimatiellia bacterium]|jgi:hypothetical protein